MKLFPSMMHEVGIWLEMGPFELWDAQGLEHIIADWARRSGPFAARGKAPSHGRTSFYAREKDHHVL